MICVKFNQEILNKRHWLEFEYLSYDALIQLTVSFPPFHLQTHRSGQSPWLDKPWERRFRVAWIHYYKCIMYTYVDMYIKISYFKKIFSEWSIHLVLGGMEQKVLNPNLSQFWAMKYIILLSFRELQICIFLILDLNMHPNLDKIGMKRKMKKEK